MIAPAIKRKYGRPAQEDAQLLVKQCDRLGHEVPCIQRLCAESGSAPCNLASCPRCRKRFATSAVAAVIARYCDHSEVQWITVTPAAGRVELDAVQEFDVLRLKKQVARKLRDAVPKGTELMGALDVSLNLHENTNKHWQFHFHAFVHPPLDKNDQEACKKRFKRDRTRIFKPIVFHSVAPTTLNARAEYTFRWYYQRRSSFEPVTYADGMRVRPKPKKQRLQAAERVAIHSALKGYKVTDLMFLMGLKRLRGSKPSSLKLRGKGQ